MLPEDSYHPSAVSSVVVLCSLPSVDYEAVVAEETVVALRNHITGGIEVIFDLIE